MLKIFFGDMSDAVYNTASYFKYDYEDEWIIDPFVKEMIQDVDKSTARCWGKYLQLGYQAV